MLIVGIMENNNPKFLSFTEIIYLQMILFFERELVYCKKKKKLHEQFPFGKQESN